MTLTIELSPTEEAQLKEAARSRGMRPAELARELIGNLPLAVSEPRGYPEPATERDPVVVARVKSLRGRFAHTIEGMELASEQLHRERQTDKDKEQGFARAYRP